MAVLPSSSPRTRRPAPPWRIAALGLTATFLTVFGARFFMAGDASTVAHEIESAVIAEQSLDSGRDSAVDGRHSTDRAAGPTAYTLSPEEWERSTDYYPAPAVAAVEPATQPARVAEVSSVAIEAPAAPETAPVATEQTGPAPVPQPAAQPAAPAAPPVQAAPAGPAERWVAQGVILETGLGDWDPVTLANVDAALSALPTRLLASLGNPALGPLHILVNTQGRALSGNQPYGGAANFFSTNDGVNELVLYPQQSVFTIVHELGHAYNLRSTPAGSYALVLLDPEMRSFLVSTGWLVQSSDTEIRSAVDHMQVRYTYTGGFRWPRLSNDDPLEDFANSFASFYVDPAGLQASSPARYDWMAANIGR